MSSLVVHDHRAHELRYGRQLARLRKRLWIPPRWSISLEIRCPEDLPSAHGACSWGYLPNAQFRIILSCALSDDLAEWIIAHELLEAMTSDYAQLYEQAIAGMEANDALFQHLREAHGDTRNELIEWFLRILLKHERPSSDWEEY